MLKGIEESYIDGFLTPTEVWQLLEQRLPFPMSENDLKHAKAVYYLGWVVMMWMNNALFEQQDEHKKNQWSDDLRADIEGFAMRNAKVKGSA